MFERLRIHGGAASILWGYRPAVTLRAWAITKVKGRWQLTATVERVDAFSARQKPLLFTAPRDKGFWAWGVEGEVQIVGSQLRVQLGPPEQ